MIILKIAQVIPSDFRMEKGGQHFSWSISVEICFVFCEIIRAKNDNLHMKRSSIYFFPFNEFIYILLNTAKICYKNISEQSVSIQKIGKCCQKFGFRFQWKWDKCNSLPASALNFWHTWNYPLQQIVWFFFL